MADPARYDIDVWFDAERKAHSLFIERSVCGKWIKADDFDDYKAGRRRNSTEEAVTSLGVEVAHLRAEVERLNKQLKREKALSELELLELQKGIIPLKPNDGDFNDVNEWIKVGRKVCKARKAKEARKAK